MSDDMKQYKVDTYAGNEVQEYADAPVPTFLKITYVVLPIWGVVWWLCFWDGSQGFLDRGYWEQLGAMAGTKKVTSEQIVVEPREHMAGSDEQ